MTIGTKTFLALCALHQRNPSRPSFSPREVTAEIDRLPDPPRRNSLYAHLSQHVVANVVPSTNRRRYLYREPDGSIRLFRPAVDASHPDRANQPTCPEASALDPGYVHLLDWYRDNFLTSSRSAPADPFLALRGLGKHVWKALDGEDFIRRLRLDPKPVTRQARTPAKRRAREARR